MNDTFDEKALDELIEKGDSDAKAMAELYLRRGKLRWRRGDRSGAITDYEHAVALDPESPAATALEATRSIMDFFNPDIFNP